MCGGKFFLITCATVLYLNVQCYVNFCWILFWMCNLFHLYLLVLFHLLKVFVSWHSDCYLSPSFCLPFICRYLVHNMLSVCFTGIQSVNRRFELNQCQINVAALEQIFSKKSHAQWDAMPDPGYFCFPLNRIWLTACQSSFQNLRDVFHITVLLGPKQ